MGLGRGRSSEHGIGSFSAQQVLGPPNVYPRHGDIAGAWAPSSSGGGAEHVTVRFPEAVDASAIVVVETSRPGALVRVDVTPGRATTVLWEGVSWEGDTAPAREARILSFELPSPRRISALRVVLSTTLVAGWNEIDAIGLLPHQPGAAQASCALGTAVARLRSEAAARLRRSASAGELFVPDGTFSMGSASGEGDELPVHEMTLSAYLIDRTEVTIDAYARCVQEGQCASAATTVEWPGMNEWQERAFGTACNANFTDRGRHPVNCVTWTQADAYCRWSKQRLPTEVGVRGARSRRTDLPLG